ncbi:MAG TPA: hypothetical protein VGL07_16985 [Buttiauxella sp.]|jgi:hypothetical protein
MCTKLLCVVSLLGLLSTNAYALDGCDAILEQGVRNTYSDLHKSNLRNIFNSEFCSSTSQDKSSSGGWDGGVSLQLGSIGLGLTGSSNSSDVNNTKNQYCSKNQSDMSDQGYTSALRLVADPKIIDAWSQCKNRQGGLIINGEVVDDSQVNISIKFMNVGSVSHTTIIRKPQIIGMTCDSMVEKDQEIDGNEQYFSCDRIGERPVTLIINTNFNGAMLYIPHPKKVEKITPPPPPPENCEPQLLGNGVISAPKPGCPAPLPFSNTTGKPLSQIKDCPPISITDMPTLSAVCERQARVYCKKPDGSFGIWIGSARNSPANACGAEEKIIAY